jgi:hypothetical protein
MKFKTIEQITSDDYGYYTEEEIQEWVRLNVKREVRRSVIKFAFLLLGWIVLGVLAIAGAVALLNMVV